MAWTPRLKRQAIILDYEERLRLSQLTDKALAKKYGLHTRSIQKILKKHRERKERIRKHEEANLILSQEETLETIQ